MKSNLILASILVLSLFLFNNVSAISSSCSVYGIQTVCGNIVASNVNDSNFLLGYTWSNAPYPFISNCPAGQVAQNITQGGLQCITPSSASGGNASWNQSFANTLYAPISSFGNASWNQSYANTLYILGTNTTINGLVNNISYLTTYNSTYDSFWLSNGTIWSSINTALAGSNKSFNQTLTDSLYISGTNASINGILNLNSSLWSNALNKYNSSYDSLIQWGYNQTTPAITYTNTVNNSLATFISNTYVPFLLSPFNVDLNNKNLTNLQWVGIGVKTSLAPLHINFTAIDGVLLEDWNATQDNRYWGILINNGTFSLNEENSTRSILYSLNFTKGILTSPHLIGEGNKITNISIFNSSYALQTDIASNNTGQYINLTSYVNTVLLNNITSLYNNDTTNDTATYIPYVGGSKNVNIGVFNLTTSSIYVGSLNITANITYSKGANQTVNESDCIIINSKTVSSFQC